MVRAKITITGSTERQPKINADGSVDLVFKIPMSKHVPRGLKSLGGSYYLVHVAPKSWAKVSERAKDNSFYIILGETKASKTNSGTPLIEVVCFDIYVNDDVHVKDKYGNVVPAIEDNNVAFEASAASNKKRDRKPITWYSPDEVIYIHTKDVFLTDDVHLNAKQIKLGGLLKKVSDNGVLDIPIAVKPLDNDKYTLVMGIKPYAVAKMLDLDLIPAVIRTQTHDELVKELGIKVKPW